MNILNLEISIKKRSDASSEVVHSFAQNLEDKLVYEDSANYRKEFMQHTIEGLEKLKQNTDEFLTKILEGKLHQ